MINWASFDIVGNEVKYAKESIESTWVSNGSYIEKLESEISNTFDGVFALLVSNGTAALQLSFRTLSLKPNDHVLTPAFCFQASTNVLLQIGVKPIVCDIDPLTWNISLRSIKKSITKKTKGIVVVHSYGVAAEIIKIKDWASKNGLWVIEDSAEAWFSKQKNKFLGTIGDIGTFSMHAAKTISSGEGGLVLIKDKDLYSRAKLIRSHGLDRGKRHYFHELPGNNFRLSNVLAAIGYAQFEKKDEILKNQDRVMDLYKEKLSNHWGVELQEEHKHSKNHMWNIAVYIHISFLKISRNEILDILKSEGVECRPGFYSTHSLPYLKSTKRQISKRVSANIIVMPCSKKQTPSDITKAVKTLLKIIDKEKIFNSTIRCIDLSKAVDKANHLKKFCKQLSINLPETEFFKKIIFDSKSKKASSYLYMNDSEYFGGYFCFQKKEYNKIELLIDRHCSPTGFEDFLIYQVLKNKTLKNKDMVIEIDIDQKETLKKLESYGFTTDHSQSDNRIVSMVYYH